jgi:hypothetical protein
LGIESRRLPHASAVGRPPDLPEFDPPIFASQIFLNRLAISIAALDGIAESSIERRANTISGPLARLGFAG